MEAARKKLIDEWNKKGQNLETVKRLLAELKSLLDKSTTREDYLLPMRDWLEVSALAVLAEGNLKAFESLSERALAFYATIPPEIVKNNDGQRLHIAGLRLMHLLAQHRQHEFHSLLESSAVHAHSASPFIAIAVQLERSLNEGAYNRVVLSEQQQPSPLYGLFVRQLKDAVRKEIADAMEVAERPPLDAAHAAKKLFFDSLKELAEFGAERGWRVEATKLWFREHPASAQAAEDNFNPVRLAEQALSYAIELERIH